MLSKNIQLEGTYLKEGITQFLSYFRKSSMKSEKSESKFVFFKVLHVSFKNNYFLENRGQVLFMLLKMQNIRMSVSLGSPKIGYFSYERACFSVKVNIYMFFYKRIIFCLSLNFLNIMQ